MTAIAVELERRELPQVGAAHSPLALPQLRRGDQATIVGYRVDATPAISRRLFDLGFVPGARVRVVRRAPALDPVVYEVNGCEMALRREVAAAIQVKKVADHS